jgi:hypothetical protein
MEKVALLSLFAFLINLPFGYFRSRSRRYSLKWFLSIHIPIVFIVAARLLSNIDFVFVPLFIAATVAGQLFGGRLSLN